MLLGAGGVSPRFSAAALAWVLAAACITGCAAREQAVAPVDPPASARPPIGNPPDPGPAPPHHGLDDDLLAAVTASTVHVGGIACGRSTKGSGFAVAADLIATSAHTIVGLDEATISGLEGLSMRGVPVAFDAENDLALLKVDSAVFEPLPLGSAAADDTVGALMAWEDPETPDPTPFRIDRPLTLRIAAVESDEQVERKSWLMAAEVELGDSGAALVDADGTVLGVAFASTRRDDAVGYATRASELEALLAQGPDPNTAVPDC